MRVLTIVTGLILSSANCVITSCSASISSAEKNGQINAEREKRISSTVKNCEIHGGPMERKWEISLDSYPFDVTGPFQKKRQMLFFNDGTTFSSCCGYHPTERIWVCPECSRISIRERKRRGISE